MPLMSMPTSLVSDGSNPVSDRRKDMRDANTSLMRSYALESLSASLDANGSSEKDI
jgi:hypothetical protein